MQMRQMPDLWEVRHLPLFAAPAPGLPDFMCVGAGMCPQEQSGGRNPNMYKTEHIVNLHNCKSVIM